MSGAGKLGLCSGLRVSGQDCSEWEAGQGATNGPQGWDGPDSSTSYFCLHSTSSNVASWPHLDAKGFGQGCTKHMDSWLLCHSSLTSSPPCSHCPTLIDE